MPTGVIDFGDVVRSWLVADLATAITSLLVRERRSPLLDACAVVTGFHGVTPLREAELAAVWPLVAARAAVLATSVDDILAADPGNDYAREEQPLDWLILDRAASVPFPLAEIALRQAVGLDAGAPARTVAGWRPERRVVELPPDPPFLDFSVTSTLFPDATWTIPAATREALEGALHNGLGVTGGGATLPFVVIDSAVETPSVHLGVDAFVPARTEVRAPAAGVVAAASEHDLVLRVGEVDVTFAELEPLVAAGDRVQSGELVGHVLAAPDDHPLPPHLHLQLTPAGVPAIGVVEPSLAAAWQALSPDASALLGLPARCAGIARVAVDRPRRTPRPTPSTGIGVQRRAPRSP